MCPRRAPVHLALASCLALLLGAVSPACAAEEPTASIHPSGTGFDLAGEWGLWLDPGAVGIGDGWAAQLTAGQQPDSAPGEALRLPVPGPLEALPQTMSYDGVAWLAHAFSLDEAATPAAARWRLHFDRVNYHCRAWLDGEELGTHEGSYEAFTFDLGERPLAPGGHVLVLRVLDPGRVPTDGMTLATTPHAKESWYENFGGVLGPVTLQRLDRPLAELRWLEVDADTGRVSTDVALEAPLETGPVEVELSIVELPLGARWPADGHGAGLPVVATARGSVSPDAGVGRIRLSASVPDAARWSPDSPRRYAARVRPVGLAFADEGCRAFGFRALSLDADGLHIDGHARPLAGVLYQPHFVGTGGMLPPAVQLEAQAEAMRAAGFDLVRAHVRPAPPALLEAADRIGLLVLEEPAIGWLDADPALPERLLREVDAMLERDHHHPSIVMWGLFNELSGKAYQHGELLMGHLCGRDPSRPVLLDSGGFFGRGAFRDAHADASSPMLDEHVYPPYPLPTNARLLLRRIAAPQGPGFVSEFGFGALVDAATARDGFFERNLRTTEAGLFGGQATSTAQSLRLAEGWTRDGWVEASLELQASAAGEMLEALRCNPGLDLLCYTQWQAVSSESSAGLLDPWGAPRKVLGVVTRGLRPLLVAAFPERPSVLMGEQAGLELVVVNDGGAPVAAELQLEWEGAEPADAPGGEQGPRLLRLERRDWPVGVTTVRGPELTFGRAGLARLRPRLASDADRTLDAGREVTVAVLPLPPGRRTITLLGADGPDDDRDLQVRLFDPLGDPLVTGFAARQGFELASDLLADEGADRVALLGDPTALATDATLSERVELWRFVERGGSAMVMLPDPSRSEFGRLVGGKRGRLHLVDVPVRVEVGSGAGNFMGRVYPLLEAWSREGPLVRTPAFGPPNPGMPWFTPRPVVHLSHPDPAPEPSLRVLGPEEGDLTPQAMLVGELPPGSRALMLAVGPIGNRIGTVVAWVPFGRGAITFVGMPLLEPVDGRPDPRRDAVLAHLVMEVASETAWHLQGAGGPSSFTAGRSGPLPPLEPQEERAIGEALEAIRAVAGLADRYSVIHGGSQPVPAAIARALDELNRGVSDLARRNRGQGRAHLLRAFESAWSDETAAFLALEQTVLDGVRRLRESGGESALLTAHEAIDQWENGVVEWFTGRRDTAFAWLGRAELLVGEG